MSGDRAISCQGALRRYWCEASRHLPHRALAPRLPSLQALHLGAAIAPGGLVLCELRLQADGGA